MQMLHDLANDGGSNGQLMTETWIETQKEDVKNLLYSRRLLNTDDNSL